MRPRSFWKETAVASGILGGLACIGFGMQVVRSAARGSLYRNAGDDQASMFGVYLAGFGILLIVVCFLFGVFVAFGIGPNFLAKRVEGAVVEERFLTSADGEPIFDAPADDYSHCFLRLRLPGGEVVETKCSPAIYRSVHEGTGGTVRLIGERMVSFDIKTRPAI